MPNSWICLTTHKTSDILEAAVAKGYTLLGQRRVGDPAVVELRGKTLDIFGYEYCWGKDGKTFKYFGIQIIVPRNKHPLAYSKQLDVPDDLIKHFEDGFYAAQRSG